MIVPIYLPYETKFREFDGRLLLISHLLNAGFSEVYFGSKNGISQEALLNNKGIIIYKSLSKEIQQVYDKLKTNGLKIALLHVEGGIHYKENSSNIESAFPAELLKWIDLNFVFGNDIKKDIVKYCGAEYNAITVVSGEPRFDLIKPRYASFFQQRIADIKLIYKDYILINTNFSAANPAVGVETAKDFWLNDETLSVEAKGRLMLKMDFQKKLIQDYINMVKSLAEIFPAKNFVIRPHPSELDYTYQKQFKHISNVHVTKNGNVVDWILGAMGVIHYDCTTGMEAILANKPTISYLPKINEKILAWLPVEMSIKAYNLVVLTELITKIFDGTAINEEEKYKQNRWSEIINNFAQNSSEIICNELINISTSYTSFGSMPMKNPYMSRGKSFIRRALRIVKKKLVNRQNPYNNLHKFGRLSKKEVTMKLDMLKAIEGFNYSTKVKKIRPDVVLIKKCNN